MNPYLTALVPITVAAGWWLLRLAKSRVRRAQMREAQEDMIAAEKTDTPVDDRVAEANFQDLIDGSEE